MAILCKVTLQSLRELLRQQAMTAAELAQELGLTRMRVSQLLRQLLASGELRQLGYRASSGGRPAKLYEYIGRLSRVALIELQEEEYHLTLNLELLNAEAQVMEQGGGYYALLDKNSFNQWLDVWAQREMKLIVMRGEKRLYPKGIRQHLLTRYACDLLWVDEADALLAEREGSLCLYWQAGEIPRLSLWRGGQRQKAGNIDLLPSPSSWLSLDYDDNALVEEMVARLLSILSLLYEAKEVTLYADCWSERLCQRVRYNLSTKLRGIEPPLLQFLPLPVGGASAACRHFAAGKSLFLS